MLLRRSGLVAPRRPLRGQFIRLRLEAMESRVQPDGVVGDQPFPPPPQSNPPINQQPQIVDFTAEQVGNGTFVLTGRVLDENPEGLVITLGGRTSASGITVTAGPDGYFTITVILMTDGTDTGYITATTTDAEGLTSEVESVLVTPTP